MTSLNLFEPITSTIETYTQKKRHKVSTDLKLQSKKSIENDYDDLLVFGYGCKLFHDDTLALKIETDAYLIPWNGDQNLLIDRYDCRGYLYDLTEHDADLLQQSGKLTKSNDEDTELEKLCDEERYSALNKLLEEEQLRQEEELKRFYQEQTKFGAVSYNYEDETSQNESKVIEEPVKVAEIKKIEVFVPSDKLQLPIGMFIPETRKHNSIIEKTASFVAKQGLQMEILIKTKQASNTQFAFLELDHTLNPYYKHLVQLIKSGKYEPTLNDETSESQSDSECDSDNDEGYLHPLLAKGLNIQKQTNEFKPCIKDSPYNELIQKFSSYSAKMKENSNPEESPISKEINEEVLKQSEPPKDVKQIIDKLADYVARNGSEFEETIKAKNDFRFAFLNSDHEFNPYYKLQLESLKKMNTLQKPTEELNPNFQLDDFIIEENSPIKEVSKEKQAERKAKAALFLNKIADKSKKRSKTRSRSRSRHHHRRHKHKSRSRSRRRHRHRTRSRSHRRKRKHNSRSRSRRRSSKQHKRHRIRSSSRHKHKKRPNRQKSTRSKKHRSRSKSYSIRPEPQKNDTKRDSSISSTLSSSSDSSSSSEEN